MCTVVIPKRSPLVVLSNMGIEEPVRWGDSVVVRQRGEALAVLAVPVDSKVLNPKGLGVSLM
ncbi:hypothetical protein A6770_39435 [Nostoc minutum NIES-26]|uniref:Uncharacterized protein n=1 Tax=Nostoc minutum NIES-26 TaxID=1844469 RepID=A0A367RSK3_9NOSO|nr:hypothetical protein A6770_39435 [Nostoc minutum NIES-26]